MSITSEAMTINLVIGTWAGYKLDKAQSAKVTDDAGAQPDSARVNKHLVAKEDLAKINSAGGAVRNHFYARTLPWKDNGDRLLPRKAYTRFVEEHAALRATFEAEVTDFVERVYPNVIDRASFRMGEMFDNTDYPHPAELARRFYITCDIDAVSTAGDFRVTMDQDELESIQGGIEARVADRMAKAAAEPWTRLMAALTRFQTRLTSEGGQLREAMVASLSELAETIPDLNFTSDPNIDSLCARIGLMVKGVDAKTLRKDDVARTAVSSEAARIMADMSGFMAAFAAP